MKNNILVQYKGGGFDGCFWEWNYAAIIDGDFHDIYSSGCKGCQTEEELDNFVAKSRRDGDFYIYPLTPDGFDDFAVASNPGHVHGVAKAITSLVDFEPLMECECCGCKVNPAYMTPTGWAGAGGIAIQTTRLLCYDCYSLCLCSNCGQLHESPEDAAECYCLPECPECGAKVLNAGDVCNQCL